MILIAHGSVFDDYELFIVVLGLFKELFEKFDARFEGFRAT